MKSLFTTESPNPNKAAPSAVITTNLTSALIVSWFYLK